MFVRNLEPGTMKFINAPTEMFEGQKFIPKTYLIEDDGYDNVAIHRELDGSEVGDYDEKRLFSLKGKIYLACIANVASQEMANSVIESYWKEMKQLNKHYVEVR